MLFVDIFCSAVKNKKNKAEGYTKSSLITLKEANRGNTKKRARLRSTHHAMERELAHKYSIYSSD